MKWLLALQYWEGDRDQAAKLVDLIADLEPEYREDVSFALVARHDSRIDPETLAKIRAKMPAEGHVIPSGLVGYPGGCNSLWRETVLYAAGRGFDFVLTFEADCTPLVPNWVNRLRDAVNEIVATKQATAAVFGAKQGPWVERNVHKPHINGNCVVRLTPKLVDAVRKYVPSADKRRPWDLELYETFQRVGGAVDIREIRSDWRSQYHSKETAQKWIESGVVFHHGTRDYSLARQVRRIHDVGFPVGVLGPMKTCYGDDTPSFHQQARGLGGTSGLLPGPGYNCAEAGSLFVTRTPSLTPGLDDIFVRWGSELDGEVRFISQPDVSLEDPRAWVQDGVAHVLVAAYLDRKLGKCRQRLFRFRRGSDEIQHEDLTGGKYPIEKNWLPVIEPDGKPPQYLYAVRDGQWIWRREPGHHVPVRPTAAAEKASLSWQARFGEIRGSTPPVLLPGSQQRLVFFHSHRFDPIFGRRYYVGAAILSTRANGYRTLRVSKEPLFVGSARDGFRGRIQNIDWPALLFFPGSAEIKEGKTVRLVGGLNDCWSAYAEIPLDQFLSGMSSG